MPLYPSFPDIQTVAVTGSIITTAVQSGSYTVIVSGTQSITGTVGISGPVSVSNFPAVQVITGSVLALPTGVQTVNGTVTSVLTGTVQTAVTNFPATQVIQGAVSVGNVVAITSTGSLPVSIMNVPTIAGTVTSVITGTVQTAVTSIPNITGSVNVTNSIFNVTGTVALTAQPIRITTTGSLPVSGAFGLQDSSGRQIVVGPVASGSTAAGNPVLIAGVSGSAVSVPAVVPTEPNSSLLSMVVRNIEVTRPTFYAVFDRITIAANKYIATIFNTDLGKKVVIQRVWVFNWQTSGVTGLYVLLAMYRISARTAGTSITIRAEDTNDVIDPQITADTNSSSVTQDHLIKRILACGDELSPFDSSYDTLISIMSNALVYERRMGQRGITLRRNQGISIRIEENGSTAGSVSAMIEFTQEDS